MIPIKLSIKGLYSYQEKQTIDFTKLTSAHLFGIFGTVGSGKSSILEAITFALYGKTERLNLSGDNRNYNMMNLKSDELLIEYVFKTGNPQKDYQVIVRGRRNTKKFDDVKTLERSAYVDNVGNWEPIPIEKIEEVIGLSYENFKRTIIIPQGLFQEFLQLTATKRSDVMKELFHLQKYELYYKVVALENRNNEKLFTLEGRLKELGEIQPIQVEEKKIEYSELQRMVNELKVNLEKLTITKTAFDRLMDLQNRLIDQQQKKEVLLSQQEEIAILEKQLIDYEYCLIHFKPLLDVVSDSEKRLKENTSEVTRCKTEMEVVNRKITECLPNLELLKLEQDNKVIKLQQVDELVKIIQINNLNAESLLLQNRIGEGEAHNTGFKQKLESKKGESNQIQLHIKQLKSQRLDISELTSAKEWYFQQLDLLKLEQVLLSDIKQLEEDHKAVQQEFDSIRESQIIKDWTGKVEDMISFLELELTRDGNKLHETDEQIEHFSIQAKLAEYASELHEGKPCPLCGSLHHPEIFSEAEAAHILQKNRALKETIKQKVQLLNQLLQKATNNRVEMLAIKKKTSELSAKLASIQQQKQVHQLKFIWENYPTIEGLNAAIGSMETLEKSILHEEQKLELHLKEWETEQQNLQRYQQGLEELKHRLTEITSKYSVLKSQLSVVSFEEWCEVKPELIGEEAKQIKLQTERVEKEFQEQRILLETLQKRLENLKSIIDLRAIDGDKELQLIENKQLELTSLIMQSRFSQLETILAVLTAPLDTLNGKTKVDSYKQQVTVIEEQLRATGSEIAGKEYDSEAHRILDLEFNQMEVEFATQNKLMINAESELKRLESGLAKLTTLTNEREKLELRSANLKTLKQLFHGSKFVNYISTVYLQNLCNDANNRFFKLSGQKLRLEITEDNSFQVRDFMNDGKVRHVKTLSGGQTFQAALSLALALADSVQRNSNSQENFFFLDEGFGSLDKESLLVVFETLKTLRNENRIVGIISHVEELQQEIDAHIRVTNSDNFGSFIASNF